MPKRSASAAMAASSSAVVDLDAVGADAGLERFGVSSTLSSPLSMMAIRSQCSASSM
jgi:hypothetical protein